MVLTRRTGSCPRGKTCTNARGCPFEWPFALVVIVVSGRSYPPAALAGLLKSPDIESGQQGRVAYEGTGPNEALNQGVEKLCMAEGFCNALVRVALGSLANACLYTCEGGIAI